MGAVVTLEDVRVEEDGLLYPRDRLEGLSSAFMGFCAAFYGRNDCVWVADAGLEAVCVDVDVERLKEMRGLYPYGWVFVEADAFWYAERRYALGGRFDVVSLDPPTQLFAQVAENVELWCSLARRLVVLGTGHGVIIDPPKRWQVTDRIRRSSFAGGTYWTVIERV